DFRLEEDRLGLPQRCLVGGQPGLFERLGNRVGGEALDQLLVRSAPSVEADLEEAGGEPLGVAASPLGSGKLRQGSALFVFEFEAGPVDERASEIEDYSVQRHRLHPYGIGRDCSSIPENAGELWLSR